MMGFLIRRHSGPAFQRKQSFYLSDGGTEWQELKKKVPRLLRETFNMLTSLFTQ